ncbi:hypothetical protein EFO70_04200 [Lacticaseibacillus rhamnosus]|nr:hypothetical protein [Lacticaseibacillus rhamnosus]MCT3180745.1 hypothetical protein [Lacticaseibacillus rhamnosus]
MEGDLFMKTRVKMYKAGKNGCLGWYLLLPC